MFQNDYPQLRSAHNLSNTVRIHSCFSLPGTELTGTHTLFRLSFSGHTLCSVVTCNTNTYTVRWRLCPPLSGRSFRLSYENMSTCGVSSRPLTPASSYASRTAASNSVSSDSHPPLGNTRFGCGQTSPPGPVAASTRLAHRLDDTSNTSRAWPSTPPPLTGMQHASCRPCAGAELELDVPFPGILVFRTRSPRSVECESVACVSPRRHTAVDGACVSTRHRVSLVSLVSLVSIL